jgi:hypothetical protein
MDTQTRLDSPDRSAADAVPACAPGKVREGFLPIVGKVMTAFNELLGANPRFSLLTGRWRVPADFVSPV